MKKNRMLARIAVTLTVLTFMCLQLTGVVSAVNFDIANGSVTINDNNSYSISGISSGTETIIVTGGQPEITLDNLTINADSAPAIDIQGGEVTLIIRGVNSLRGGATAGNVGLAGIRVAVGATLTISASSTGTMAVTGGNAVTTGAGAGIGSNGGEISFGTIVINGGEITATGGTVVTTSIVPSAGAGIGTGGTLGGYPLEKGTIKINGGTVNAFGGNGNLNVDSLGGAGIGSGSNNGGADSMIEISITGGTITAKGGLTAAGIGGGSNIPSGPIFIGGTAVVQAFGGIPDGSWGGAGIGGGDNGYTQGITITGNSRVLAVGAGTAAGIGGGFLEGNWGGNSGEYSYTISGNASVVAVGGSTTSAGGAGIGSGYIYYDFGSMGGIINILDNAKVEAYGGIGANAIGNGIIVATSPTNDPAEITIANSATIKAFTADAAQPALNENTTVQPSAILYSFTGTAATAGAQTNVATPTGLGLTWSWATGASPLISVSDGISFSANGAYRPTIYNWAYISNEILLIPEIISPNSTTFTVGSNGSFQVEATNNPTSFAYTGTLPAGLTFNTTTGLISGTPGPGTAGTYTLIVTASNADGTSVPQTLTLLVQDPLDPDPDPDPTPVNPEPSNPSTEQPKTGDYSDLTLWIILVAISVLTCACILMMRRLKKSK